MIVITFMVVPTAPVSFVAKVAFKFCTGVELLFIGIAAALAIKGWAGSPPRICTPAAPAAFPCPTAAPGGAAGAWMASAFSGMITMIGGAGPFACGDGWGDGCACACACAGVALIPLAEPLDRACPRERLPAPESPESPELFPEPEPEPVLEEAEPPEPVAEVVPLEPVISVPMIGANCGVDPTSRGGGTTVV